MSFYLFLTHNDSFLCLEKDDVQAVHILIADVVDDAVDQTKT